MMPPAPVRRPLTIMAWTVVSSLALVFSPVILATGALTARVLRRPQAMVAARLVVEYFRRELLVLAACGGLWVFSGCGWRLRSPRFEAVHYELLRWFVHGLAACACQLLDIDIVPEPSPEAEASLAADRPVLFFSRHAGPGDTVLLIDLLMSRHRRLPSIVFKDVLTVDPCIDLLGHRLPHAVLHQADAEACEARIADVAGHLVAHGVLVLFPEGGNFTPQRRRRAITSLWRKGRNREAAAGERMAHVLPPHPGGALAALRGSPGSDVVFAAHTGLGLAAFPRQLWREAPFHRTLTTRMWAVSAAQRPADPGEQVAWLYDWWARIDAWVDGQGEPAEPEAVLD